MDSNTVFFFYNKMKITNSDVSHMWLFVRHKAGYLMRKERAVGCIIRLPLKKKTNPHTLYLCHQVRRYPASSGFPVS